MEFILFSQYLLLNKKQGLLFTIVTKGCDSESSHTELMIIPG